MPRLLDRYNTDIVPALSKKFGRDNRLSLPKLQKIVINMGVGKALQDKDRMKAAAEQLGQIAGQRPQVTKAMDITFVTSTRNDDEARELLRSFGMPFRES